MSVMEITIKNLSIIYTSAFFVSVRASVDRSFFSLQQKLYGMQECELTMVNCIKPSCVRAGVRGQRISLQM